MSPSVVLLSLTALACLAAVHSQAAPPETSISAGKLRGKWMQTQSGRPIAAFEGVPYAQPPVGELRFKSPVPAASWEGVKAADNPGPFCLQRNIFFHRVDLEGSEDCLTINVYTPETISRPKPLPVMVFIHGGGWISGTGSLYGPEILLDKEVLLVTFNYRLGALGFFSTGDEEIPGNFGLKDTVLALRWVRDNIRAFGGDPNLVTIFGESAGGATVSLLMISPLSKGLFHRAIAMSGTAISPWSFNDQQKTKVQVTKMAKMLGCPDQSSSEIKKCLMAKTAEEIQGTDVSFMEWMSHPLMPFRSVVEPSGPEAFQERAPLEALEVESPMDVPFMTGFTTHEGCIGSAPILESPEHASEFNERWLDLFPLIFFTDHLPKSLNKKIYTKVRQFYFGNKDISKETKGEFTDMISDFFFVASALEKASLQQKASKSPVFIYEYGHLSDRSFAPVFAGKDVNYGACHADDLFSLFPLKLVSPKEPSAADKLASKHMVDLFTNFALTGNPTPDGSWPAVQNPDEAEYVRLDTNGLTEVRRNYSPERMKVWRQLPVRLGLTPPRPSNKDEL